MRNNPTRFILSGARRPNLRHLPEAPGEFVKVHLLGPPQRSGIRSVGVEALACTCVCARARALPQGFCCGHLVRNQEVEELGSTPSVTIEQILSTVFPHL